MLNHNNTNEYIIYFIVSRLEMYYQEQGIDKAVVRAVLAIIGGGTVVYDWHLRIEAVHASMITK
jgi:glycyl-tRNA synthetase beta subunit